MVSNDKVLAWLERASGGRVDISGSCSIGRMSSNGIMLPDERVSRRHALINIQDNREFWLVDFGSGNGTYLNGRRVVQPTRLRDGDKIEISVFQFIFHEAKISAESSPPAFEKTCQEKTLKQIKSSNCWLLVADIEDSTLLMKRESAVEMHEMTGRWLDTCRQLVEACGGNLNKFLGDGFLAYWRETMGSEEQVARALEGLVHMETTASLRFRIVLHFGQVFMGGAASLGEESLQGKEVHFVFRMEKLAASIGERCLISEAAKSRLPTSLSLVEVGSHEMTGFEGQFSYHSLTG